ncbi:nucleotide exchange factor GrpE [Planococcus lenghuensis]|uniref:Nucleotide exchange factor GrpE n=1 Tax=Planococcus lenghuensis TaxID=2213202 RepID=A0A1Q2L1B5_9BACL|nr:nucleotide exchange factor GrpE [Planococcus lenghuensis]AQQ54164.1 nucleotide exchange factor GrpE [Planococcus lenghuensis]
MSLWRNSIYDEDAEDLLKAIGLYREDVKTGKKYQTRKSYYPFQSNVLKADQHRTNDWRTFTFPQISKNTVKSVQEEPRTGSTLSLLEIAEGITAYLKLVSKVTVYSLFHWAVCAIRIVKESMAHHIASDEFPIGKWESELYETEQVLKSKVASLFEGGENILTMTFQEIIDKEKESLQFLEEFYYDPRESEPNFLTGIQHSLLELQEQIKGDFKNSNRVTYKLMQEFQQQLEEFTQISNEEQSDEIEKVKKEALEDHQKMMLVAIGIFDMLDLIYQSALKANEIRWSQEIEKAVTKTLSLLEMRGIIEIPVMKKLLDGKTMECIGTIPQHEVQEPLEKYQVFAVHQRGFMDRTTGRVLRKASVTSII